MCIRDSVSHAHLRRGARWSDDPAVIEALKIKVPQQLDPPIRRPGAVTMYIVPATRKFQAKQKAKAKRRAAANNKPATTSTTQPG